MKYLNTLYPFPAIESKPIVFSGWESVLEVHIKLATK